MHSYISKLYHVGMPCNAKIRMVNLQQRKAFQIDFYEMPGIVFPPMLSCCYDLCGNYLIQVVINEYCYVPYISSAYSSFY